MAARRPALLLVSACCLAAAAAAPAAPDADGRASLSQRADLGIDQTMLQRSGGLLADQHRRLMAETDVFGLYSDEPRPPPPLPALPVATDLLGVYSDQQQSPPPPLPVAGGPAATDLPGAYSDRLPPVPPLPPLAAADGSAATDVFGQYSHQPPPLPPLPVAGGPAATDLLGVYSDQQPPPPPPPPPPPSPLPAAGGPVATDLLNVFPTQPPPPPLLPAAGGPAAADLLGVYSDQQQQPPPPPPPPQQQQQQDQEERSGGVPQVTSGQETATGGRRLVRQPEAAGADGEGAPDLSLRPTVSLAAGAAATDVSGGGPQNAGPYPDAHPRGVIALNEARAAPEDGSVLGFYPQVVFTRNGAGEGAEDGAAPEFYLYPYGPFVANEGPTGAEDGVVPSFFLVPYGGFPTYDDDNENGHDRATSLYQDSAGVSVVSGSDEPAKDKHALGFYPPPLGAPPGAEPPAETGRASAAQPAGTGAAPAGGAQPSAEGIALPPGCLPNLFPGGAGPKQTEGASPSAAKVLPDRESSKPAATDRPEEIGDEHNPFTGLEGSLQFPELPIMDGRPMFGPGEFAFGVNPTPLAGTDQTPDADVDEAVGSPSGTEGVAQFTEHTYPHQLPAQVGTDKPNVESDAGSSQPPSADPTGTPPPPDAGEESVTAAPAPLFWRPLRPFAPFAFPQQRQWFPAGGGPTLAGPYPGRFPPSGRPPFSGSVQAGPALAGRPPPVAPPYPRLPPPFRPYTGPRRYPGVPFNPAGGPVWAQPWPGAVLPGQRRLLPPRLPPPTRRRTAHPAPWAGPGRPPVGWPWPALAARSRGRPALVPSGGVFPLYSGWRRGGGGPDPGTGLPPLFSHWYRPAVVPLPGAGGTLLPDPARWPRPAVAMATSEESPAPGDPDGLPLHVEWPWPAVSMTSTGDALVVTGRGRSSGAMASAGGRNGWPPVAIATAGNSAERGSFSRASSGGFNLFYHDDKFWTEPLQPDRDNGLGWTPSGDGRSDTAPLPGDWSGAGPQSESQLSPMSPPPPPPPPLPPLPGRPGGPLENLLQTPDGAGPEGSGERPQEA